MLLAGNYQRKRRLSLAARLLKYWHKRPSFQQFHATLGVTPILLFDGLEALFFALTGCVRHVLLKRKRIHERRVVGEGCLTRAAALGVGQLAWLAAVGRLGKVWWLLAALAEV